MGEISSGFSWIVYWLGWSGKMGVSSLSERLCSGEAESKVDSRHGLPVDLFRTGISSEEEARRTDIDLTGIQFWPKF